MTGRIEQGVVKVGDEVEIRRAPATQKTVCTGVEMFHKLLDQGQAGDNIGALLRGVKKEEVERGQVLCKPGSITPHTNFEANVYVLRRKKAAVTRPSLQLPSADYLRTTDVTGTIALPEGTEMVMPGDTPPWSWSWGSRSLWTRAFVLPSGKVAAPSAPAGSRKS